MKKRLTAAIVSAALLVSLSGCAGIFKKEYLSVTEYEDNAQNSSSSDIIHISDYSELKSSIITMINNHETEGRLRFTDYDGTIQSDISQALLEVKEENALAGFAVNYTSYDLSSIVTYYEAVVHITYKRSQSEVEDIRYVTGRSELKETFGSVLNDMDSYIALKMISSTITADEITSYINAAYEENPASCVVPPSVTVTLHPETGLQRIIEVEFEYGWKLSELQKMKSALTEKIDKLVSGASDLKYADRALSLYKMVAQTCSYDPDGKLRSSRTELDSGLGSTAYGALMEGYADSKGMAAAYSALCYASGINCLVVNGMKDGEDYSWDIIELDGNYYHVDAAAYFSSGITHSFMQSDQQMEGRYVWDTASYPACIGESTYSDIVKKIF